MALAWWQSTSAQMCSGHITATLTFTYEIFTKITEDDTGLLLHLLQLKYNDCLYSVPHFNFFLMNQISLVQMVTWLGKYFMLHVSYPHFQHAAATLHVGDFPACFTRCCSVQFMFKKIIRVILFLVYTFVVLNVLCIQSIAKQDGLYYLQCSSSRNCGCQNMTIPESSTSLSVQVTKLCRSC